MHLLRSSLLPLLRSPLLPLLRHPLLPLIHLSLLPPPALVGARARSRVSRELVPWLKEGELEESFIKGSGPGGQAVNKMVNAVFLRHTPTGLWVKVHQSRALEQNRKIARKLLTVKLDNFVNGEDSVENQEKKIAKEKIDRKKEKIRLKYSARAAEKESGDVVVDDLGASDQAGKSEPSEGGTEDAAIDCSDPRADENRLTNQNLKPPEPPDNHS